MFRLLTVFYVTFLFLMAIPKILTAQGSTTAAINGRVTDANGEPLPGAVVVALHIPTGTIFGSTTRVDGLYNISNMKAGGPYKISVSYVGFKKQEVKNVNLKLSSNLEFNFKLENEAWQASEVTITANRSSIISSDRTGAATNVSNEIINEFPTVARSLQDFVKFTPQFSGTSFSAQGRNNRYNNIQVDGTQYNDKFGLGSTGAPGGQANINPLSLESIQEFQVVIAPYDVKLGGFTGGGINAITKSGTNELKAGGYYYGRNQNLAGYSPDALKAKLSKFTEYQAGASVGGSILRDKLFYFVSGELTKRDEAVSNISLSQNTALSRSKVDSLGNVFRNTLTTKYGYDPGNYNAITKLRPSQKLFTRLDWNISDEHKLTLRHNYVNGSDEIISPGVSTLEFPDHAYKFDTRTNSTVLQFSSTFGNTMSNELILGLLRIRDRRHGENARPFSSISVTEQGLVLNAGGEPFSQANEVDQDVIEVTDNFTYYLGEHTITAGTHNEFFKGRNLFIRDYYGTYSFASMADFINGKPKQYDYSYAAPLKNDPRWAAKLSAVTLGFYVQDEWRVLPNLKITLGIRVDDPILPDTPTKNDSLIKYFGNYGISTNKVPSGNLLWSPRLGFNWDVHNDQTMQVRGGAGIFTGSLPFVWLANDYLNTGLELTRIRSTASGTPFIYNPFDQPKAGDSRLPAAFKTYTSEIDASDPNLKMPQVMRFNIAVDRKLPFGLTGTLEFLYSKAVNDLYYVDYSVGAQTGTAFDGRPVYSTVYKSKFTDVFVTKNENKSYSYNFSAQIQGSPSEEIYTNIGYTYGTAKDLNSVPSSQAVTQWTTNPISGNPNNPVLATSNYELKHRLFAGLSYTLDMIQGYETTISLFYNGQSGRPFSYTYNGSGSDINADGSLSNDLIYIPKDNDPKTILYAADDKTIITDWSKVNAFINADDYLKSHRGQIAERNKSIEPWIHNVDLKIVQKLHAYGVHCFEISLDILNVLNLMNSDWGFVKTVKDQNNTSFKYLGIDSGTGKAKISFSEVSTPFSSDNILSRWQMQLGVQYSF